MKALDLHPPVRGLALWTGKDWRFGAEAFAACRVDPQSVSADHWESISLHPLAAGRGGMRHRADLAAASLKADRLGADPVAALAPAGWEREELQVFLGAAQSAGLRVRWLLPRCAAAAAVAGIDADTCEAAEWSWNQLRLSGLRREDGCWRRGAVRTLPDAGIFSCFRREAGLARDILLDTRRYDPLDSGRTEQALFLSWWRALGEGAPWIASTPDGGETDLSPARPRLAALHPFHLEDRETLLLPAALRQLLGFTRATPEPASLDSATAALEDHDAAGTRWRDGHSL